MAHGFHSAKIMAVVTTSLTPTPARFPYANPYGPPGVWSTGIPREELIFTEIAAAIAVATGGNTQRLIINLNLPSTDAYVLVEANFSISGADADEWNAQAFSRLQSEASGVPIWSIDFQCPGLEVPEGATSGTRVYSSGVSNKVIVSAGTSGGLMFFKTDNNTADGSLMTVNLFARFLVFDRIQAQNFSVNTPTPTR